MKTILQIYLLLMLLTAFAGYLCNWKLYYPQWAREGEQRLTYRYLVMFTAPFSWIYVFATYRKRNSV